MRYQQGSPFMSRREDVLLEYLKKYDEPFFTIFGDFDGLFKGSLARALEVWLVEDYDIVMDIQKISMSMHSFYLYVPVSQLNNSQFVIQQIAANGVVDCTDKITRIVCHTSELELLPEFDDIYVRDIHYTDTRYEQ
jgi:hypothetical protein